jgi:hypothetical protein
MYKFSFLLLIILLLIIGCRDDRYHTQTRTNVNVKSYIIDANQFDLGAVMGKLKQGTIANAGELSRFINMTPGVNNVDINKDGFTDEVTVSEERTADGKFAMVVKAHPKSSQPVVIAEIQITKTAIGTQISGSYPHYVGGYQSHYYNHTLTGSMVGDMMFYRWLYAPRPVYVPIYHQGMYYSSPHPVYSRTRLRSIRITSYTKHSVSPITKTQRPSSYKPRSTAFKKQSSSMRRKGFGNSKLSSRKGSSRSFSNRGSASKRKATGFRSRKNRSFGRSRRRSFGGSRRRSFGGSRRR